MIFSDPSLASRYNQMSGNPTNRPIGQARQLETARCLATRTAVTSWELRRSSNGLDYAKSINKSLIAVLRSACVGVAAVVASFFLWIVALLLEASSAPVTGSSDYRLPAPLGAQQMSGNPTYQELTNHCLTKRMSEDNFRAAEVSAHNLRS